MGFSKLKIPRICEHCSKPFEAETVTNLFSSFSCANKEGKERKKQEKVQKETEDLLLKYSNSIAQTQPREFITVLEATVMFEISSHTIHKKLKRGLTSGENIAVRLTRVKKSDLEALFVGIKTPSVEKKTQDSDQEGWKFLVCA